MGQTKHTEQIPPTSGGENEEAKPDFHLHLDWWDIGDSSRIKLKMEGTGINLYSAFLHMLDSCEATPQILEAIAQFAFMRDEKKLSKNISLWAKEEKERAEFKTFFNQKCSKNGQTDSHTNANL